MRNYGAADASQMLQMNVHVRRISMPRQVNVEAGPRTARALLLIREGAAELGMFPPALPQPFFCISCRGPPAHVCAPRFIINYFGICGRLVFCRA